MRSKSTPEVFSAFVFAFNLIPGAVRFSQFCGFIKFVGFDQKRKHPGFIIR